MDRPAPPHSFRRPGPDSGAGYRPAGAERAGRYEDDIHLKRFGVPSDIADSVLFLVSDAAATSPARGWSSGVG
jgi:hypothetical protein